MGAEDDLAARVRKVFSGAGATREVKMFGGIGFMLNGNMVAAASKRGLLVRVGKERHAEALKQAGARSMEMRGRIMEGYVYVDPAVLTDEAIKSWLQRGLTFVRALPSKAAKATPKTKKGKRK